MLLLLHPWFRGAALPIYAKLKKENVLGPTLVSIITATRKCQRTLLLIRRTVKTEDFRT